MPKFKEKYNLDIIANTSPYRLMTKYSEKELRGAYRKFRIQFLQREKLWAAAGMADDGRLKEAAEVYRQTLRKADVTAVAHALHELTKWLRSAESTPEGAKAADMRRLRTLQDKGFKIKNVDELKKFGQFMESVRPFFDSVNRYSQEAVASLWKRARKVDINAIQDVYSLANYQNISLYNIISNYEFYASNYERIRTADLTIQHGQRKGQQRKKQWTARDIAKRIGVYSVNGKIR